MERSLHVFHCGRAANEVLSTFQQGINLGNTPAAPSKASRGPSPVMYDTVHAKLQESGFDYLNSSDLEAVALPAYELAQPSDTRGAGLPDELGSALTYLQNAESQIQYDFAAPTFVEPKDYARANGPVYATASSRTASPLYQMATTNTAEEPKYHLAARLKENISGRGAGPAYDFAGSADMVGGYDMRTMAESPIYATISTPDIETTPGLNDSTNKNPRRNPARKSSKRRRETHDTGSGPQKRRSQKRKPSVNAEQTVRFQWVG